MVVTRHLTFVFSDYFIDNKDNITPPVGQVVNLLNDQVQHWCYATFLRLLSAALLCVRDPEAITQSGQVNTSEQR